MSGLKRYWIICSILLIAYVTVQFFRPKATDWTPTYLAEDKKPFGAYILRQRITDIFPGIKVKPVQATVYTNLKSLPKSKSNYFIIGTKIKIDRFDYREMVNYIAAGNNVFIAAYQIEGILKDTLKLNMTSDYRFNRNDENSINFINPLLKRKPSYTFDKGISEHYFSKFDTAKAVVLGDKSNSFANFIAYKFGKGNLFILPNPQLLTNYSLLKTTGQDYAAKALSYLPLTETFIWDEHFTRASTADQSVLRVIFKYDELRWAYYLALFGLLLFVAFEIKRRQRVIPIIDPLQNTTVAFVEVVGRVYYQQKDNADLIAKKVNYLLAYIRQKYRLKTQDLDTEFSEALIKVSSAQEDVILELLQEIKNKTILHVVSDEDLIRLNKLMEKFYEQDQ